MQTCNFITNLKVKIYFTLPAFSAIKIVTWGFHVDLYAKSGYDAVSGRYLLTELWLNI